MLGFQGASILSSISIVNILSLYTLKNKNKKKVAVFIKKSLGFSKFNANQILLEANFLNFDHQKHSLG